MKKLFLVITLLAAWTLWATDGDTLQYNAAVDSLDDGDTFFVSKHWSPLKDSIQSIVNGRLGNVNLADDAEVKQSKLDSTRADATDWLWDYTKRWQTKTGTETDINLGGGDIDSVDSILDCANIQTDSLIGAVRGNVTGSVTAGAGETINVTGGTLTLDNDELSGDKVDGGTIASIAITQLTNQKTTTDTVRAVNSDGLWLQDDGGNGLIVEDGGFVGIGIADPEESFHTFKSSDGTVVHAEHNAASFSSDIIRAEQSGDGSPSSFRLFAGDSDSGRVFVVLGDGSVGIDTTTPEDKLHVNGNVKIEDTLEVGDRVNGNLIIDDDVYTTDWTDYSGSSTVVGWSGSPTTKIWYKKLGDLVFVAYFISGTSDTDIVTFTLPYSAASRGTLGAYASTCSVKDNGTEQTGPGILHVVSNGNLAYVWKDCGRSNTFTSSGDKWVRGEFFYEGQ